MTKKILVLSTYPIKNPQHGGQKRLAAIVNAYIDVGYTVKAVGIFDKAVYKDHTADDISLGISSAVEIRKNPWTGDIVCGRAIIDDPHVKEAMKKHLIEFAPNAIHLEQPFVYLGLEPLLLELGLSPTIIYGSQNVEAPMKREILESQYEPESEIYNTVKLIGECERRLVKQCDLLTACTKSDLETYWKMGADKKKTVLSQNGIDRLHTTEGDKHHWENIYKKNGIVTKILFIASAHPPSITGFIQMIGKGLGFLAPHQRMMIAGSVSDYFKNIFNTKNLDIGDATFWIRAVPCGRLSESSLGALIESCDVLVLPITEGGGSNLKTAEAIMANKKVVATSHALRSFEWAAKLPNIWIADTQDEFVAAIRQAIDTEIIPRTKLEEKKAEQVLWVNQLAEFRERIKKI
ncbi:MAG: hypothetical protein JWM00_155 [Candidatus Saccharibacteria bacterium]|nr:hypothetical protein [Candidatus Saccharibacteria bacterium]